MIKLIDELFDRAARHLADNMCNNFDVVEQNRNAREVSTPFEISSSGKYIFTA